MKDRIPTPVQYWKERAEKAEAERDKLRALIHAHNEGCDWTCTWRYQHNSCAYRNPDGTFRYGNKECSDCPRDGRVIMDNEPPTNGEVL